MRMWSPSDYCNSEPIEKCTASVEEISAFIDERIKPNPLPGALSNLPPIENN